MAPNDSTSSNVSARGSATPNPTPAELANIVRQQSGMLEQLQEHIALLEGRIHVRTIKLPKPEFFDGTRAKLRPFLTQMEMQLRMSDKQNLPEADKVIYVSTYLRGHAFDWFEPFIREFQEQPDRDEWSDTTTEVFSSFANFKKRLELTFGDIDATRTAERRLKKLRQTTSASTYVAEFQQIISHLNWDEETYISFLEDGFKEDVKDELARMERPNTLKKLIDVAVRIDNRMYDRKMRRQEIQQWRGQRTTNRPYAQRNEARQGQRRNQPKTSYPNDYYGPRPMELDAARLPAEEQKRRKDGNLCFNCGRPGHRARECKSKRNENKPQQLRATAGRGAYDTTGTETQQLRATGDWGAWGDPEPEETTPEEESSEGEDSDPWGNWEPLL